MRNNIIRRYIASTNHLFMKFQHKYGVLLPFGQPLSAMIEICNICNLKCTLCPAGNLDLKRPRGFMEEEVFKLIVDQLDDRFTKHFTPVMWGESLLHPKFLSLMKYAAKKDWHISISTNGNIRENRAWYDEFVAMGIDEIVCAVDGHDQDSYSVYRRGGSLERVHEFLANMKKARDQAGVKRPRIIAQIHLLKANEHHRPEIEANIGSFVDLIQTKMVRTFYTDSSKTADMKEKGLSLKPENKDLQFPGEGRPSCPSLLYYVNVNWEGEVIACCKDPENVLRFGNIRDSSLHDIRRTQKFVRMRQELLRGIYKEEICRQCYKF